MAHCLLLFNLNKNANARATLKPENNWRSKSIESLEKKNFGPVPEDDTNIVTRLWKLRKIPINEFEVDDIRFMILQGAGLNYLLIEAIQILEKNLLTEGSYYEGDLLNSVLQLNKQQWEQVSDQWNTVNTLIKDQLDFLRTVRPKLEIDNFYNCRPS